MKLQKFVNSDEGLPCVNTVEKVYLGLLVTVFALGILSLFRLAYYKAELRRVFDSRYGFTIIKKWVCVEILLIFRVKWYGIEPFEETEANELKIYGEDCKCDFDLEKDFKCVCGWNDNITLKEHRSFQDFRLVSKPGING